MLQSADDAEREGGGGGRQPTAGPRAGWPRWLHLDELMRLPHHRRHLHQCSLFWDGLLPPAGASTCELTDWQ